MACNESHEPPVENLEEISGVEKMLNDFYCAGNKNSRSSDSNIRISRITRQSYRIEGDTVVPIPQPMGRSMDLEHSDSVFEIATAEFSIGDNNGYAILSDDERLNEIYFFTENGAIADTADIPAVKDIFELTPFLAMQTLDDHRMDPFTPVDPGDPIDPDSPPGTPEPIDKPEDFTIGPMIKTKWDQGWPYNMYGRHCTCIECSKERWNEYSPMGCVAIATAQVIATWDTPLYDRYSYKTFYGTRSDVDVINKAEPITKEEEKKAAHICYEVALGCQTKFACGGSHSKLECAYQYLKEIGCGVQFVNGSIDAQATKSHLIRYPILVAGKRSSGKGHAWIIDGLKCVNGVYHYHCNWGLKSSAWVSSNYYTAENEETHELTRYSGNLRAIYIYNQPFPTITIPE